jgi:hypothetical protein
MSWLFSRVLVAEYLGDTCLDGAQSVQSNGNPTQQAYCAPDKMTAFSRLSRFGMTFKPLTEDRGQELLTLYLEGFRAKTSAQPEKAPELTEKDPECGHRWQELLARYDPATSSWKTPQSSLLGDYTEFSETWPRWGLMQDGVSYQRQTLVRHTRETESGLWATPAASDGRRGGTITDKMTGQILPQMVNTPAKWPTPIAQDAKHSGYAASGPGKADKLSYAVVKWPTPQASDNKQRATANSTARRMELKKQISLEAAVKFWPTPTSHNAKEEAYPAEFTRNTPTLSAQAGGTLNPSWVEWLMGWPLGWTDLKRLEMDKFLLWRQQHGDY